MAQFRIPNHPYDPHFALPQNVMDEPPGRGTITTAQIRRRTFDSPSYVPPSWSAHFALPRYIQQERLGKGAQHTHWAQRKTIDRQIHDPLLPKTYRLPEEVYALDGIPADNPFQQYGQRIAEMLVATMHEVPVEWRQIALKALLDELEPGLYGRVTRQTKKLKAKGVAPKVALQSALASSLSEGLSKEIIKVGRTGKVGSITALGMHEDAEPLALAGIWGTIKDAAGKVGSGIKTGTTWTGSKVKTGAVKSYNWSKTALSKIKGLTCTVVNSQAVDIAAGATAAAYGAPPQVGVAGGRIVSGSVCGVRSQPTPPQSALSTPGGMVPKKKLPGWVIPVGLGAAGVAAYLILKEK